VSELEGNIGQKALMNVQGLDDSQAKIENAINEINSRSRFAKFLIGPKYKDIKSLKIEIIANQAKMRTLTYATNQMIDPAAKFVLKKQINIFIRENDKLRAFVAERERGASFFGWLAKLFS
jgi:hypothetical protein